MSVVAVVGAQWGDEGKGRIIDLLAQRAHVVVRYQGGSNAGHTVVNSQGTFKLHLVPAGIFNPAVACVVGPGVVIDPIAILAEIEELEHRGISVENLHIGDRAHVVMPYHFLLDRLEEEARGNGKIGTTGRGIGPAYVDKAQRIGIRMVDLVHADDLREKLQIVLPMKNEVLTKIYGTAPLDEAAVFEEYRAYGARLARYVSDVGPALERAIVGGKNVLLEGGQGTLLDLDHGTYPFVTASSPTAGGACSGAGLGPSKIDRALGVFKAYTTRVGAGPFPTELLDAMGEHIRERGAEYGTTTGRPRRCGWFDAAIARYSTRINGFSAAAITKLDVLDELETIRICVGYQLDGKRCDSVPARLADFGRCEPVWEELPGWRQPTTAARALEDLPANARAYLDRVAELLGLPIDLVSVGASREQVIIRREAFA
jgi:adenylosuccinate synthase